MKVCSKCKIEKDESEFYKSKITKDGLYSNCKECHKKICIKRAETHREESKENLRKWRLRNPEKVKKMQKKHREKNIEKRREETRIYRKNNRELLKAIRHKAREDLTDLYIRRIICSATKVSFSKIPQALVDCHREVIRAKRFLKELQK